MTECKTEYITKEQALKAIKGKMWPGELEAAIKAIPPVDVMEVTRCEDCRYYNAYVLGNRRGFADQAPSVWQQFLQPWEEYLIFSQGEDDI